MTTIKKLSSITVAVNKLKSRSVRKSDNTGF